MTRLSDAYEARMPKDQAYAYGRKEYILDGRYGGQLGYAPNLAEAASASKYVRRQTRHMVWEPPGWMLKMPNPAYYIGTLKSMVETHAKSWEGFAAGLELQTSESNVGGANEVMEMPTKVTRARTQPRMSVIDLQGRPFQNMLVDWLTYGIMDPTTQIPLIATIADIGELDYLLDMYSMTMLSWECDPYDKYVTKAWLTAGMMPKATGDIIGGRDITQPGDQSELSIDWTGFSDSGYGIIDLAQSVVDSMSLVNANPNMRRAFSPKIDANVNAPNLPGYAAGVSALANSVIAAS